MLTLLVLPSACRRTPPTPTPHYDQEGIASWYGRPFDGRKTANGEIFQLTALTAAHRTYPFGTILRVVTRQGSQSVDVRINDRGPFVAGRIIDLSQAAATKIGIKGTAEVTLQILSRPTSRAADNYAVQVGEFTSHDDAETARQSLQQTYGTATLIHRDEDQKWRALVGMETTLEGAEALCHQIPSRYGPSFAVLLDPQN